MLTTLDAALDAWDRNNAALVGLLHLIPAGGFEARAADGSPTVAEMFTHMHHERMVSVHENAPECSGVLPETEWRHEPDADHLAGLLAESAAVVRRAVASRIEAGRGFDKSFAHPIQLLHFLTFHEGYHHGQIKLALKLAGCPIADTDAGPVTWRPWRAQHTLDRPWPPSRQP